MTHGLRFSAHIGYLFNERALEQRIGMAREAGFECVEHPDPSSIPAARMRALLDAEEVAFIQLAVGGGSKGLACLPGRQAEFREVLARVLDYAEAIGCRLVHPQAGVAPSEVARTELWAVYLENMAHAVEAISERNVDLLVEPISEAAIPGYFIATGEQALEVIGTLGSPRISILLDTFHARVTGLDTDRFIAANMARIGHIHVADHPGRHEPGSGAIDFSFLIPSLVAGGYRGAVGFEYIPTGATGAGLGWLPEWRTVRGRAVEAQLRSGGRQ